jgi:hypothetical protein
MHSIPWLTAFEIHAEKMQNPNLERRGDVTGALSLSLSLRPCISRQVKSPSPPWFHKQGIPVKEMAALLPGDENSLPPPVTKERKQEKRKNPISVFASRTSSTDA